MSSSTSSSSGLRPGRPQRAELPWALFLTLVLFGVLEVALRLHHFGPPGVLTPWRYTGIGLFATDLAIPVENPSISWGLRPNARRYFKGALLTTNSHGFRDREVAIDKPERVLRIAVLGASMTVGSGVADHETYTRRLQGLLDRRVPGRFQVLNFAVAGYDERQFFAAYGARAARFSPDVVLLRVREDFFHSSLADSDPPTLDAARGSPTALRPRLDASFAYRAIRRLLRDLLSGRLATDWPARGRSPSGPQTTALDLLDDFARARAAEDVRVIAAVVPSLRSLAAGVSSAPATVRFQEWAASRDNVDVIDAYERLYGTLDPADTIYYGDSHPSARGHQRIATALLPDLLRILADLDPVAAP